MLRWLMVNGGCVVAIVVGGLASLLMLGGCIAGSPNMTPKQIRGLKAIMWTILAAGTIAGVGGGWLLNAGRPGWGAIVGASPAIALVVILIWISVK
jgi:hypothetical protein